MDISRYKVSASLSPVRRNEEEERDEVFNELLLGDAAGSASKQGGADGRRQHCALGRATQEVRFRSVQFIPIPGVSRRGGSGTARCRDAVSGRVARGRAA